MRQKLFTGWSIALMMFMLYSCSSEINDHQNNEEIESMRLDKDSVTTRWTDPWKEEEETPLEWIDTWEGTSTRPVIVAYMYIGDEPEFKYSNDYISYVLFDWSAGFLDINEAENYMMQIQYSYRGNWYYINMPNSNYGLVKVLSNRNLEDIPAFAFPYTSNNDYLTMRMRTIHKDFIISTPRPGVDSQYKYDSGLVSVWAECSMPYLNPWGFGKPQLELTGGNWDDSIEGGDTDLIVTISLPQDNETFKYSYEMYNHSGGFIQSLGHKMNFMNEGKANGSKIGSKGGEIEVIAKRKNIITNTENYETVFKQYSVNDRFLDIYIGENSFGYY